MKKSLIILVAISIWAVTATAGTLQNFYLNSESLGFGRWVQAYLPDGYDAEDPDGYPAIYYLHGFNGSHVSVPEIYTVLDDEIAAGRIQPVIVIKPHGDNCDWGTLLGGCGWVNSELQGDYEDFVV